MRYPTLRQPNLPALVDEAQTVMQVLAMQPAIKQGTFDSEFEDDAQTVFPARTCINVGDYQLVPVVGQTRSIAGSALVTCWRTYGPVLNGGYDMRTGEPIDPPEPEEQEFETFSAALLALVTIYAADHACRAMERISEQKMEQDFAEADRLAADYFARA